MPVPSWGRASSRNVQNMSAKDHPNNAPGVPMVYPPAFERLQIKYMNPLVKRISRFMPGVATIKHRGRKSGKSYETVVTPIRNGNVLAVVLGHGKTDWVKNVLAAGEAEVRLRQADCAHRQPANRAGRWRSRRPAVRRAPAGAKNGSARRRHRVTH